MGFIEDAQKRAERRKSKWNLLLFAFFFSYWGAIVFWQYLGIETLHQRIHPDYFPSFGSPSFIGLTALILSLLAAIPFAFLLSNASVWLIPQARRALDLEAKSSRKSGFLSSQRALFRLALYVSLPCLTLSLIGAALPW